VPTITIIDGVRVVIYYNDHAPPHFHAMIAGDEAQISIRTLAVLRGSLPPTKLRKVLEWAKENQGALALHWINAQADEEI
jgi:hypothetical protein